MKALKKLLTPRLQSPTELAHTYLQNISIQSSGELHIYYQTSMNSSLRKCQQPSEFLSELINKMQKTKDETTIIKMLTLIHYYMIFNEYSREEMKPIEEMDINNIQSSENQEPWFSEFLRSYLTYFVKIYSQSDIYEITLSKEYDVKHQYHLTHLFRLTNTIATLFPHVLHGINTVGRYQAEKYRAMKELFVVLSGELAKVYGYIKYLCNEIFKEYRLYDANDLKCFIEYLPDLELLCDKIEDILGNKYIKGRKAGTKIEFKEEIIAELQYYLDYEYKANVHNETVESLS